MQNTASEFRPVPCLNPIIYARKQLQNAPITYAQQLTSKLTQKNCLWYSCRQI